MTLPQVLYYLLVSITDHEHLGGASIVLWRPWPRAAVGSYVQRFLLPFKICDYSVMDCDV